MKSSKRNNGEDIHAAVRGNGGFTLLELIIAMAVGLILLGAMYGVFTMQSKTFDNQEQVAEMQQSARAAMDMMSREIRMAGYNPAGVSFYGVTYSSTQLQIKADLDGNSVIAGQENIIYAYDGANHRITRNIGSGDQPFVENVQAFTFQYLNSWGYTTATTANIRKVRITIVVRTAKPDPEYTDPTYSDHYRRYTLTSLVTARNLSL